MKCARELFPHSERQAEIWAVYCYERWTRGEGGTPEQQRDRRNPNWKKGSGRHSLSLRSSPTVLVFRRARLETIGTEGSTHGGNNEGYSIVVLPVSRWPVAS